MEKFKGAIKAKKRERPVISKNLDTDSSETSQDNFIVDVAKKISGFTVNPRILDQVMKNLQIDPSKNLSEDDLFLIYNVLTEPLFTLEKTEDGEKIVYSDKELSVSEYQERLLDVSKKFMDILPNQRVNGIYDHFPSLENNRINFEIEKDIFRNKPLLGKGIFKCGKCGSDDTEDYEKQTRSADEPMTVFVHCRKCNAYFRFG